MSTTIIGKVRIFRCGTSGTSAEFSVTTDKGVVKKLVIHNNQDVIDTRKCRELQVSPTLTTEENYNSWKNILRTANTHGSTVQVTFDTGDVVTNVEKIPDTLSVL